MSQIGYARVSTADQNPQLQLDAFAGCDRVFVDTASGKSSDRPQLAACLEHLRAGDTLTVWKLDRLGRSLSHLIAVTTDLAERGVAFHSITEGLDTSSASGRLLFHIMGALAEFERSLIVERTRAGLDAARKAGRTGGPKPKLSARDMTWLAEQWDKLPVEDIAAELGISRATAYRARARADQR